MGGDLSELSRAAVAARSARVWVRRAARLAAWRLQPAEYPSPALGSPEDFPHLLYRRAIPISAGEADARLERGKRANLALAAPHLDGLVISPERPFSFWRAVPRPTAARGYQLGTELRGGCLVPSAGGGLCLLSNTLFEAASWLGWRILERHAHTMARASACAADRPVSLDATVLWPHVDLRFAPRAGAALLEVRADRRTLSLAIWGDRPAELVVDITRVRHLERTEVGATGPVRTSAVRRTVRAPGGELLEDALLTLDRVRLLDAAAARRTCFNCERDCHARPADVVAVLRTAGGAR